MESPTLMSPLSVYDATIELAISGRSVPSASNVIPTKKVGSRVPLASFVEPATADLPPVTVTARPMMIAPIHNQVVMMYRTLVRGSSPKSFGAKAIVTMISVPCSDAT